MASEDPRNDLHLDPARARELDECVARARTAADAFRRLDQAAVDRIVWAMVVAGLESSVELARVATEETGFGAFEDKVVKNLVATEFLYDYLKDKKTVGVIREEPERNLRYVAEPIGVVMAILPVTNPTSTVLFKAIVAAKTRNALLCRPSPRAIRCALRTAEILRGAVVDVLISKTFDASVICPAEQTCVVDDAIYDEVVAEFERMGARLLSPAEVERLAGVAFLASGEPSLAAIGRSPHELAALAGFEVPEPTKVLLAPLPSDLEALAEHLLVREKLMPVLGIVRASSEDHALAVCDLVTERGGLGHTSAVYARDPGVVERYALGIRTGRVLVNAPTAVGALESLRDLETRTVVIVTDADGERRGVAAEVGKHLGRATVHVFSQIEPEPGERVVWSGVETLQRLRPDLVVAVGGGSVLDAAKAMRLFHENPQLDLKELVLPFLDARKRVARYPRIEHRVRLVAVPTTAGTGSEVSPASVISVGPRKVTLVDYSLVPDVAIVDPLLTLSLPPSVTADTGGAGVLERLRRREPRPRARAGGALRDPSRARQRHPAAPRAPLQCGGPEQVHAGSRLRGLRGPGEVRPARLGDRTPRTRARRPRRRGAPRASVRAGGRAGRLGGDSALPRGGGRARSRIRGRAARARARRLRGPEPAHEPAHAARRGAHRAPV